MPRKVAPQCRAVKRDRAARTGRVDYVLEAKRRACKTRAGAGLNDPRLRRTPVGGKGQTLKQAYSQCKTASARCVQRLDDSRSAIRITYRISLRSSSSQEPRYPLLKVISIEVSWQAAPALLRARPCHRLPSSHFCDSLSAFVCKNKVGTRVFAGCARHAHAPRLLAEG